MRRRILPIMVGLVLIAAALLKLQSFIFAPFEPQLLLPHRWQHLVLIEMELALGAWLLSGQALQVGKVVAMAFFGMAALASVYLGWIGQESCGCFGKVPASPWLALAVDLACFLALLFVRGDPTERFVSIFKAFPAQVLLTSLILLGLGAELFFLTVKEPESVLARWRGDILTAEPTVLDAGAEEVGKQRTVKLRIHNYSDRIVAIVGGTSSCSCIAIESLPVEIKPGGGWDIQVVIRFTGTPGEFLRRFVLYTDHPAVKAMLVPFRGEILERSTEPTRQQGTAARSGSVPAGS